MHTPHIHLQMQKYFYINMSTNSCEHITNKLNLIFIPFRLQVGWAEIATGMRSAWAKIYSFHLYKAFDI